MKTITVAYSLIVAVSVAASPTAVEQSLRSIPPGSTDLVPRVIRAPEVRIEFGPVIEARSEWSPELYLESRDEKPGFRPAKPIRVPLISEIEEKEN